MPHLDPRVAGRYDDYGTDDDYDPRGDYVPEVPPERDSGKCEALQLLTAAYCHGLISYADYKDGRRKLGFDERDA